MTSTACIKFLSKTFLFATLILTSFQNLLADVSTAGIFGDNMVLQRNMEVPVWGWSDPGDDVVVTARDQSISAKADKDGRWMVKLKPMDVGKSFELTIKGSHNEIAFKNVVVGEVWICSGQSNMEWTVNRSGNPENEKAAANHPMIRHIKVQRQISTKRELNAETTGWQVCSPQTAGEFTAVGYYFGRHLNKELNVPIGLINTTWGGTIVEAWTSGTSLKTHPDFAERIAEIETDETSLPELEKKYEVELAAWQKQLDAVMKEVASKTVPSTTGSDTKSKWESINAPGHWETQGHPRFNGFAWYHKTVEVPEAWVGKELMLSVARCDDSDTTFVNGTKVGTTVLNHNALRNYPVASNLVDDNSVDITVCVQDTGGAGGIHGKAEELKLGLKGSDESINLAGKWDFKIDEALAKLPPRPNPPRFSSPNNPTALFNAMVNPLIPYAFKGTVWYQGEANASRAKQYQTLFPLLIEDWRKEWKRDFPFYWVQLANFMAPSQTPTEAAWAELREAQSMTRKLPQTGEAVIIDIGDRGNIHPKNKQDVGKRLALHALAKDYGKKVVYSGPRYKSMTVDGNKIRLDFDFADGLKASDNEQLHYFSIAGEDKKFVWADAKIDGNTIVVSSDEVKEPVAVRYAWANNPEGCNLTNDSGIPASPFRTDSWPGVTDGKK